MKIKTPGSPAAALLVLVAAIAALAFSVQDPVKGRAFGSPLARDLYPRASTAEVDPRAMPGAPAAEGGRTNTTPSTSGA